MGTRPLLRLEKLWIGSRRNIGSGYHRPAFCFDNGGRGNRGSPRGDDGPTVNALDEHTGDARWRGNNRLDSLRNIVEDGRVSLLFLIGGKFCGSGQWNCAPKCR